MLAGRGRVGLHERLEEFRRLLRRHADAGVAHGELELHLFARAFEQFDVQPDLAALGELDGVVDEVRQDLAEAERVAQQMLGNLRRDVGEELQALVVRLLRGERRDRADHFVEPEVRRLDLQLARLDLREIEDVIDDAEQRRAGVVDLAHVVALLGIERRLQREVREADDGVHRRANLVAHVREEIRLRLGGVLGLLLGREPAPLLEDQFFRLREQFLLRLRELFGLLFKLARLFLGLLQQLLRAQVALEHVHAHGDDRQQFLQQRLLIGTERTE